MWLSDGNGKNGKNGNGVFFWGELFSLFCFCFCLCCFCRDSPPHLKRLHLQLKRWKKHNSRNNKAIIPKIFTHPMGTDVLLRVGIFQLRFFLLFWQHLRELLYPQMGFLDRLVVPQDPEKKNKCIYGLASFLNKSDKLIVLWSPKYFSRLWCTCLSWSGRGHSYFCCFSWLAAEQTSKPMFLWLVPKITKALRVWVLQD